MSSSKTAVSVSGKSIRLTRERWDHIERRHPELKGFETEVLVAIGGPRFVVEGRHGELLAVRELRLSEARLFLVAVYRESGKDGFIITAYVTSDVRELERREKLWPSLS